MGGSISEMGMSFSSKLELRMTWFEARVRWRNLRSSQNLNRVPQFIPQVTQDASGNIWTPTIIFSNSPLSDQTILDQQAVLTVAKRTGPIPALPEEEVEVAYYSGAKNPVTYTRTFKNTFACVFNLKKYPFDTQVCKIQLDSPKDVEGLLTLEPGQLTHLGPVDMMQFSLLDWKMTKTETGVGDPGFQASGAAPPPHHLPPHLLPHARLPEWPLPQGGALLDHRRYQRHRDARHLHPLPVRLKQGHPHRLYKADRRVVDLRPGAPLCCLLPPRLHRPPAQGAVASLREASAALETSAGSDRLCPLCPSCNHPCFCPCLCHHCCLYLLLVISADNKHSSW